MRMELSKKEKEVDMSNRYKKLRTKHRELCRINATNRHLAIHEDVNELRSLGMFCDRNQKMPRNCRRKLKTGKRKKRFFEDSVKNRCPGYFKVRLKRKFRIYVEVPK